MALAYIYTKEIFYDVSSSQRQAPKMKIALILLACLVGASYEQGYYRLIPYNAGGFYQPLFQPFQYARPAAAQLVPEGRSSLTSVEPESDKVVPEARLGGGSVIFTLGGLFPSATSYTTTTSYTTVSSTATTATVISCIPSSLLASTTACRRRRAIFEDSGIDPELLAPSPTDEVVSSVVPEEAKREVQPEVVPEILSSQDQVDPDPLHNIRKRYVTTVSTVTVVSTSTSYSFTVTSFTKTLNLATSTSVVLCLPSGISVC